MLRTVTAVERYRFGVSMILLKWIVVCYAMSAPGKSVVHGIFMSGCVILGMKMCQNMRGRKLYNERKEEGILKYTYAPLYPGMQFCDCIRCR